MSQSLQFTKWFFIEFEMGRRKVFLNEIHYKNNCNVTKFIFDKWFTSYAYPKML
jgi:hypothetical protein